MASPRPPTQRKRDPREQNVSSNTREKAEAAKAYIEKKYNKLKHQEAERKQNWEDINKLMSELSLSSNEQLMIRQEILHREAEKLRQKRKKITVFDFEPLSIIGRGAFGEVRVVRAKENGEVLAMKKMNKSEMVYKNQVAHVRAERDVLATSENPWIVELKNSFQDEKYLYLVMEYLGGGDLMTLLMRKDILSEDESRFYIAETILAVESVHKMNYIHRDLKPDNILIDNSGHIKLSDFGLCKHSEIHPKPMYENLKKLSEESKYKQYIDKKTEYRRNRKLAYSTVGTPDYIAPEVFGRQGYSETVDWWSVGVILFEMLVGYPPFFSEEPAITCQKILRWKRTFVIPREARLSASATDLLRRFIEDPETRIGSRGVDEIKSHPFFNGIEWDNIRNTTAPYIPNLKSEIDTSNFDKFEETEPFYPPSQPKKRRERKDLHFIGYTYNREMETERTTLMSAIQELEAIKQSATRPETSPSGKYVPTSEELYSR